MNPYELIAILAQKESFLPNILQQLTVLLTTYKTNIESNVDLSLMFNNLMISVNEFIITRTTEEQFCREILLF